MWRWEPWMLVGVLGFGACGGSSERRGAGGGDAGSPDGGTSGTAGTNPTGGTPSGGTAGSTDGRGGSATSGSGGSTSGASGTSPSGGSNGGDGPSGGDGGSGDGGSGGEPMCTPGPAQNDCSRAVTCALFSCGEPWSLYDAEGCARTHCTETATCPAGERCVPAPVLGKYGDPAFYEPDSCRVVADSCGCSLIEEGAPLALCVPVDEFPPERDCPAEGLGCEELPGALETLDAYRNGSAFFFPYDPPADLALSVDACYQKLLDLLEDCV